MIRYVSRVLCNLHKFMTNGFSYMWYADNVPTTYGFGWIRLQRPCDICAMCICDMRYVCEVVGNSAKLCFFRERHRNFSPVIAIYSCGSSWKIGTTFALGWLDFEYDNNKLINPKYNLFQLLPFFLPVTPKQYRQATGKHTGTQAPINVRKCPLCTLYTSS